jgi:hypothetical protein
MSADSLTFGLDRLARAVKTKTKDMMKRPKLSIMWHPPVRKLSGGQGISKSISKSFEKHSLNRELVWVLSFF